MPTLKQLCLWTHLFWSACSTSFFSSEDICFIKSTWIHNEFFARKLAVKAETFLRVNRRPTTKGHFRLTTIAISSQQGALFMMRHFCYFDTLFLCFKICQKSDSCQAFFCLSQAAWHQYGFNIEITEYK